MTHGITVGETNGLIVRNNTLIAAELNTSNASNAAYIKQFGANSGIMVPQIHLSDASDNVTVTGNAYSGASWFSGTRFDGYTNQADWTVSSNTYYADKSTIPAGTAPRIPASTPTPTPDTHSNTHADSNTHSHANTHSDANSHSNPNSNTYPDADTNPGTYSAGSLAVLDDYVLNLAKLAKSAFKDNASVVTVGAEKMIHLDGVKDYVDLGRLTAFEKSEKIAFEVDFSRDVADGKEARLVWNHMKYGLTLNGDGLMIQVATAKEGFKTIKVDNLGLNDTDDHTIRVIMDGVSNRLQVILDGKVVLDTTSTDLKFVGAGGYESGWTLGSPWDRFFRGDISDFRVEAKADFVAGTVTAAPVVAIPTVTTPVVKTTVSSLFGTFTTSKVAAATASADSASVQLQRPIRLLLQRQVMRLTPS